MPEAIVVGAGLFGSVIACELRARDMEVVVVDDNREFSGSKPSACLIKPSWISSLSKEVINPSLDLLERRYGLEEIQFRTLPGIKAKVKHVSPNTVLKPADYERRVGSIAYRVKQWHVSNGTYSLFDAETTWSLSAKYLIIAAGFWTNQLVRMETKLTGLTGVSFLWPGKQLKEPFINVWAPYKQIAAFQRQDGVWIGDGSAILWNNWNAARKQQSERRCVAAVGLKGNPQATVGIRPYTGEKPCYLREQEPNLWVATGGAKNGIVSAAWSANEIAKRICK